MWPGLDAPGQGAMRACKGADGMAFEELGAGGLRAVEEDGIENAAGYGDLAGGGAVQREADLAGV